ncbi:MAG: PEGA domain-containing protein, partial [Lentisphaerae bacterium]
MPTISSKFYFIFLILSACSFSLLSFAQTKTDQADFVRVIIKTQPAEANVFLDGKKVSGVTPLEITLNDHDMHMLEIRKEGFEPYYRQIPSSFGDSNVIHRFDDIKLRRESVPLILDSVPRNAHVRLDGQDLGKTPVYLPAVPVGDHRVEFSYVGYAPKSFNVVLEKDEPKIIKPVLDSVLG